MHACAVIARRRCSGISGVMFKVGVRSRSPLLFGRAVAPSNHVQLNEAWLRAIGGHYTSPRRPLALYSGDVPLLRLQRGLSLTPQSHPPQRIHQSPKQRFFFFFNSSGKRKWSRWISKYGSGLVSVDIRIKWWYIWEGKWSDVATLCEGGVREGMQTRAVLSLSQVITIFRTYF